MEPSEENKKRRERIRENQKNYSIYIEERKVRVEATAQEIMRRYPNLKLSYSDEDRVQFDIFGHHIQLTVILKEEEWMTQIIIGTHGVYHTEKDVWVSIEGAITTAKDLIDNMHREFHFAVDTVKVNEDEHE